MTEDVEIDYSLFLEEPDPDSPLARHAQEHIGEDPDTRLQLIGELRDMIFESGECTPQRYDDEYLLRFLRARNFVVRHAHRMLVNYCNFKEKHPQYFENIDLQRIMAVGDTQFVSVQPFIDKNGYRAIFFRLGKWNPKEFTLNEIMQTAIVCLELATFEPRSQIVGGLCFLDVSGITMSQVKHLTPKLASLLVELVVQIYPLRVQAAHFVNQSPIFKAGYSMIKPFMSKEVRKRVFMHTDNHVTLHQHIDPKYLPEYLGGSIRATYNYRTWIEKALTNDKFIAEISEGCYANLIEQASALGLLAR